MGQLAPEVQQFPGIAKLVARGCQASCHGDGQHGMDASFSAVCGSKGRCDTLSQLVEGSGAAIREYQTAKESGVGNVLDQTNVRAVGGRVVIPESSAMIR